MFRSNVPRLHRTHLAAGLATALALAAPAALAANRVVTNCNDSGAGSLRATVASAFDSDTVDLSQLACSSITLTTGAIGVPVNNLTLTAGNGAVNAVTIDGGFGAGHHNRVLTHTGTGTLAVQGLIITDAKYSTGPAFQGGCIFSSGNVSLTASTVSHCTILGSAANGNTVTGGGLYAVHDVTLLASTVNDNVAQATGSNVAFGGGIRSGQGNVTAVYGIIANNKVVAATVQGATGGGIAASANLVISYSTISGNQAQIDGGIHLKATGGSHTASIQNSTISGNKSTDHFLGSGGAYVLNAAFNLSNSTIAFNSTDCPACGGGIEVGGSVTQQFQSSILADNLAQGTPSDLYSFEPGVVTGANNLVFQSNNVAFGPDTLAGICPKLLPLADNGGAILTHALMHISPAIDMGNNLGAWSFDERGQFYPRIFGTSADIGAYEWQGGPDARIFHNGFEAGCDE